MSEPSSTSSSSSSISGSLPSTTDETDLAVEEESEEEEGGDDDLLRLAGLTGAAQREKEKDTKTKEVPSFAPGTDPYLRVEGRPILVHGYQVYLGVTGVLEVTAGLITYQVTNGTVPVRTWRNITYDNRVARIGGTALSLDATWAFRWDVAIPDTAKYEQAAWTALRGISELDIGPLQCFGTLDQIGGYDAHVSITTPDVTQRLRTSISSGKKPKAGWLFGVKFHVTVDVYGEDDPKNPRVFEVSKGWQGKIDKIPGITASSAYAKGEGWLKSKI